jgi:hypothetical protein
LYLLHFHFIKDDCRNTVRRVLQKDAKRALTPIQKQNA